MLLLVLPVVIWFSPWTNCVNFLLQDLPRTFPGHPALDEGGRNSLRRVLIAYARHNPSVGYCQVVKCLTTLGLVFAIEPHYMIGSSLVLV